MGLEELATRTSLRHNTLQSLRRSVSGMSGEMKTAFADLQPTIAARREPHGRNVVGVASVAPLSHDRGSTDFIARE